MDQANVCSRDMPREHIKHVWLDPLISWATRFLPMWLLQTWASLPWLFGGSTAWCTALYVGDSTVYGTISPHRLASWCPAPCSPLILFGILWTFRQAWTIQDRTRIQHSRSNLLALMLVAYDFCSGLWGRLGVWYSWKFPDIIIWILALTQSFVA